MATLKQRLEKLEAVKAEKDNKELPYVVPDNICDDGLEMYFMATGRRAIRYSDFINEAV